MTPSLFFSCLEQKRDKKEAEIRSEWEQTRMIICAVLSPHLKKGASRDPEKLFPLPWDKEYKRPNPGEDPAKKLQESLARWEEIDRKQKERDVEQ